MEYVMYRYDRRNHKMEGILSMFDGIFTIH